MRIGDVVEVEWVDAACDTSEVQRHEFSGLTRVTTWGRLVQVEEDYIAVAAEVLESDNGPMSYRSVTYIPKAWDLKWRKLFRAKEVKET